MADKDTYSVIKDMVSEAEEYRDQMSTGRVRAMEYYDGIMRDTPSDEGRSKVVSRDVRSAIKKVLPSVVRTILGNDEVVEYVPKQQEDEDAAKQASDFINYVVLAECDGYNAIRDAIDDSLRLRNGILTWWWDTRSEVKVSRHTGLPDDAFASLVADDSVTVLEHSEEEEMLETEQGPVPVKLHDVRIKRVVETQKAMAACVPLEEFLIHPDATCIEDSPIVGRKMELRRSDLVAMGYDKEMVANLPRASEDKYEEGEDQTRRNHVRETDSEETDPALQEVDYYELYVRTDQDEDGIAELRRMCFGGSVTEKGLLLDEECDEVQFCDVIAERRPHQWEGSSVSDDAMEIQRIKTVLLRQTLDNLYWQNNPQPIYQEGVIRNPEAVLNPEFGKPIRVREGVDVRAAMGVQPIPFVAKDSFGMLDYLDNELTDRTGISDASSGMAPDALQNMTAKASAMIEAAGIGQTEMIVRTVANSLKPFFRGLLRLIIRHQDVERTVRLRNQWVQFDPRDWNAEMDCTVNTGLGAGTRERDMMMMQQILALQEKIIAGMGPDNPYVKPGNMGNALAKMVESAGLRTPGLYFNDPDDEEVNQFIQKTQNRPDPEMVKAQSQMELEKAKMEAARDKERAQMEADLVVKDKEIQARSVENAQKLESDAVSRQMQSQLERDKWAFNRDLELTKMNLQFEHDYKLEQLRIEEARHKYQAENALRGLETAQQQPDDR